MITSQINEITVWADQLEDEGQDVSSLRTLCVYNYFSYLCGYGGVHEYGNTTGFGNGYSDVYECGNGYGSGYGYGNGSGDGYGSGSGSGYGNI